MPYKDLHMVSSERLGSSTTLHTNVEDASHPTAARNARPPLTPLASSAATLTYPRNEPQKCKSSDPENYHDIETLKETNTTIKFDAPDAPPDGGLKAWSSVLGASLVAFTTFGFANAFGAFADFYSASYLSEFSPTLISMIGALQIFVLYLLAGVSGAMFDAIGPQYLIPFSGFIVVISLFLLSVTQPQQIYQQFLCQSVLFTIGAAFGFFPTLALMSHWFKFKMPYAVGCIISGSSIGGIVYPIMLTRLVPHIGFKSLLMLPPRILTRRYHRVDHASHCIYVPFLLRCWYPHNLPSPTNQTSPHFTKLLDFNGFKDPCYLFLAVGWFGVFSIWNPFFYVGLSAELANPGSPLNQYYLSILCASSVVGRVSPGLLASRVGRFNLLWMSTFLSAVLIFALWYTSFSEASLITFVVLYGIVAGPFFTFIPPCVASLSPIDRVGARLGFLYAFMATACLAGTPVGGVFITTSTVANYKHLILFSGLMAFIGAAFLFAARMAHDRRVFARD